MKPVVLYDGRCRLCTASAERIRHLDKGERLEVVSLHEPQVRARFPSVRLEDVLAEMHFVRTDGTIAKGHAAVREVLRALPRWHALAVFWDLPGFSFLADRTYKWVARNRYRFMGKVACEGDVCSLHGT